MSNERPNVTVIYQEVKPASPSAGTVLLELVFFLALLGAAALFGGCAMLL